MNKTMIKRVLSIIMVISIMACFMTGCKEDDKDVYDNYSIGLTDTGVYVNLDKYPCDVPDFKSMKFTCEEILEWGYNNLKDSGQEVKDVDEYVYMYGEEILTAMGLTSKEIADDGDVVSVSLEFYKDGKLMDGFSTSKSYVADLEGDAIVSSFVGHKADDKYEVDYTFPETDKEFAGQTVKVVVAISTIVDGKPIESGTVEKNLEKISEYLDGVTDTETFLAAIRPILAENTLVAFMSSYLQTFTDINLPDEYIEYEDYRLKFRLQQIGYSFENYLKSVEMTEADIKQYYEQLVRENYITMLYFQKNAMKITYADLANYYGSNFDYVKSVQGEPYMRLVLMREMVAKKMAEDVFLVGVDDVEKPNEDDKNDENKDDGDNNPTTPPAYDTDQTIPTEPSEEPSVDSTETPTGEDGKLSS
jgi:FKBP-type peptidyl-prolyl cis-trans isomerase (trigger factor)